MSLESILSFPVSHITQPGLSTKEDKEGVPQYLQEGGSPCPDISSCGFRNPARKTVEPL